MKITENIAMFLDDIRSLRDALKEELSKESKDKKKIIMEEKDFEENVFLMIKKAKEGDKEIREKLNEEIETENLSEKELVERVKKNFEKEIERKNKKIDKLEKTLRTKIEKGSITANNVNRIRWENMCDLTKIEEDYRERAESKLSEAFQ